MFILRPIRLLSSDSSCNICCSSWGVSLHRNMSSAKRRSIFTPLFSQFNLLNMLSNVAVNSLGEMVSPCLIPLLILIFSLSLCRCTVTELSVCMSFRIVMYTSSIPCSCNDVNIAWVCTESNAFSVIHESNTQWYVVFTAFLFKLVYVGWFNRIALFCNMFIRLH